MIADQTYRYDKSLHSNNVNRQGCIEKMQCCPFLPHGRTTHGNLKINKVAGDGGAAVVKMKLLGERTKVGYKRGICAY